MHTSDFLLIKYHPNSTTGTSGILLSLTWKNKEKKNPSM